MEVIIEIYHQNFTHDQSNWFDLKIKILSFYRSRKINIKEPKKKMSQIIRNFNLILAE